MTEFTPERVAVYVFRSERERELVYVHRAVYDGPVAPSDELDGRAVLGAGPRCWITSARVVDSEF